MVQYEGTTYAGTIGLSSAMTHRGTTDKWGVSINARGNPLHGTHKGLEEAVASAQAGGSVFPIFTRQACEMADSYTAAKEYLATHPLIMPGYIILGGSLKGHGAIITRNASVTTGNRAADVFELFSQPAPSKDYAGGVWFVVSCR